MRLVGSSNPGDVERDAAVHLLAQRAVLTRAVCRELLDAAGRFGDRRPSIALGLLLQWVHQNFPGLVRGEPRAADGLDQMVVPNGCQALAEEIRAGTQVAAALFMLGTADNPMQADGDKAEIRRSLDAYWANHATAACAPSTMDCWSGLPGERPPGR